MKRFEFASEVAKQLITLASVLITVLIAFYDKFFSHGDSTFHLVVLTLGILVVSIFFGILTIGTLTNFVARQERHDANSPTTFQTVGGEGAATDSAASAKTAASLPAKTTNKWVGIDDIKLRGWALAQMALFSLGLALFVVAALIDRATFKPVTTALRPAVPPPPSATVRMDRPIVWTQLRPDTPGSGGQLIARAIVARDAECPPLVVDGVKWPMLTRADGSDPDFPIRMCEAALPGAAKAKIGKAELKPRPKELRKILVIGDTGCRVTDYNAQICDSPVEWPFFRIANAASAKEPDLVIHLGDYHYREKPCAGRAGCADSPSGDTWRAWEADFFTPGAPLLTAAPWLMLRGNHEDCARAGAGWNLLIRPMLGLKPGERCPPDVDPDIFTFDKLRMIVPDTASAGLDHKREDRVVTYRKHIRALAKPDAIVTKTWLVIHQPLLVSYGKDKKSGSYNEDDLFSRVPPSLNQDLRKDLCKKTISPVHVYRHWLAKNIPEENPNQNRPPKKDRSENPCDEEEWKKALAPPTISLIISGDTHTFQMFAPDKSPQKPDEPPPKEWPLQLVVGNGGDALDSNENYSDAITKLFSTDAKLFGVSSKLWMRHTFGFAVLEKQDAAWTAMLYDVDGKQIVQCNLKQPDAGCE